MVTKSSRLREAGRKAGLWLRKACRIYFTLFSLERFPRLQEK